MYALTVIEMRGLYRAYEIEQKEIEKQHGGTGGMTAGDHDAFAEFAAEVNSPAS